MKTGIDYIGVATAFYCTDGQGKFLLHKRSKNCRDEHGKWDVGAGKLEFGSTLEENVLREVLEEYGCEGKILEQLPAHSSFKKLNGKKTHWVSIPFIIKVNPQEAKNNEPHKIDEIGWFTLDNPPSPLHPTLQTELNVHLNHFKKHI